MFRQMINRKALPLPLAGNLRHPMLGMLCLLLTACMSDSDDNPFDVSAFSTAGSKEPFSSTVYPEPRILTKTSDSTYLQATYQGQSPRSMFDRRFNVFATVDAYVFTIVFDDGNSLEALVNTEFGTEAEARAQAEQYGRSIGQLPSVLRSELEELWIHKGRELWGSVNKALYVHTDMAANYEAAGILEETLLHEAVHVSLDESHENTDEWRAAQISDDNFISTYAKNNATTEDLAESFLMWMASRYRTDTLSADNQQRIALAIPGRLSYLDNQGFDMNPVNR